MKFRCDRDALSEALQTVQRGVSSRPGIPALTGVLLEAAGEGPLAVPQRRRDVRAGPHGAVHAHADERRFSLEGVELSVEIGKLGADSLETLGDVRALTAVMAESAKTGGRILEAA